MVEFQNSRVELLAKFFHGFADSSRLLIVDALRKGPLSVGEIVHCAISRYFPVFSADIR